MSVLNNGGFVKTESARLLRAAVGASVMAWVRPNAIGASYDIFATDTKTAVFNPRLYLKINSDNTVELAVVQPDDNPTSLIFSATTISAGAWVHIGVSYDCTLTFAQFYVNGVFAGNGFATFASGTSFSDTNVERVSLGTTNNSQDFNGDIEDVRLYNRVLGASEFATIFAQRGKDGVCYGLQSRYMLTEGAIGANAANAVDLSASHVVLPFNVAMGQTQAVYSPGICVPLMKPLSTGH